MYFSFLDPSATPVPPSVDQPSTDTTTTASVIPSVLTRLGIPVDSTTSQQISSTASATAVPVTSSVASSLPVRPFSPFYAVLITQTNPLLLDYKQHPTYYSSCHFSHHHLFTFTFTYAQSLCISSS